MDGLRIDVRWKTLGFKLPQLGGVLVLPSSTDEGRDVGWYEVLYTGLDGVDRLAQGRAENVIESMGKHGIEAEIAEKEEDENPVLPWNVMRLGR